MRSLIDPPVKGHFCDMVDRLVSLCGAKCWAKKKQEKAKIHATNAKMDIWNFKDRIVNKNIRNQQIAPIEQENLGLSFEMALVASLRN